MSRILSVDYGKKRIGIAVSDPLQIIATALATVPNSDFFSFFEKYENKAEVVEIVVGYPKHLNNQDADLVKDINKFIKQFSEKYPKIKISLYDERFTSKMAAAAMFEAGYKKSVRRKKENLDKISATIILQDYMKTK